MNAKLNRVFRADLISGDQVLAKMFLQEGTIDCSAILTELFAMWGDFDDLLDSLHKGVAEKVVIEVSQDDLLELIDALSQYSPLREYVNPLEMLFIDESQEKKIVLFPVEEQ